MAVADPEQPDSQPVAPDAVPEPTQDAPATQDPDAAVAIIRTRGPDPAILLMRRAERQGDSWSGHWSLPGGRREDSDPDLLQTALRELGEECGIQLSRAQMSAALPPEVARRRTGPFVTVAPFVFDIDTELPTVLDAREAVSAVWIPQRTLVDPTEHVLRTVPGVPAQMLFPAIVLPGAPLWGFTYRLLVQWLQICPTNCPTAAFEVAQMILDVLLSRGATLRSTWHARPLPEANEPGQVQVAEISGEMRVAAAIDHLSASGAHVPKVNAIEVGPHCIRVHGLAFEQYLIEAASA